MDKLKPCPFCGHDVRFAYDVYMMPNGIWCDNCHMVARWARIRANDEDTAGVLMDQYSEAWNKRAEVST